MPKLVPDPECGIDEEFEVAVGLVRLSPPFPPSRFRMPSWTEKRPPLCSSLRDPT